jgi:soluble lytic murein transglycosylase-like protein
MRSFLLLSLALFGSLTPCAAFADVYEYVDEAGITHFSDVPVDERYMLIIKSEEVVGLVATSIKPNPLQSPDTFTVTLTHPHLLAQIEQSAQNNQLDKELIHAVIHVESAFKVQAKSYKGAQGLMQLMPATASRLGVKNSYDPAQNIEGGAKYLKELLTLFNNDLTLVIAAYNAGENAVIKYGNKIPPYKETQAYVPKVLNIYNALMKQREQVKQLM